ncbi:tRNA (adenosine(37)-N6)-threonylcarbamoyltransferase complex ATPase subunit type 1 TsaE [Cytophaga sp. FL35]|uniref:tRNA (adenosine(37)-N6)-threonylcarbamoyltransferase complex ATPase subunit type 1 TsaE n=1 Tax=Cytophaga sp. FL35 TaxID=1904456 RepID=UPI001653A5EC|nr:tRNA (adenosine(37)-N6)-threonylcarbamoyltransferase complex ATPase subunit type 1 TsaE [Cytophaga sp. FL35]MBC7000157.1 tRNA (adenosine(37)-N6)-threonylcarbamoyltransferase complex ATPase subunit type 1 TsaE [Cytophaga sp. FL35]
MEVEFKKTELNRIAKLILEKGKYKTFAFYAPMGAGKTTLIKAIVKELGASDSGSSPTFGIVNEYHSKVGEILGYHFDFYRLNDEMEALDMGLDDYLNQDCFVFIEWPEKISSLLPSDIQNVSIEIVDFDTRRLVLS